MLKADGDKVVSFRQVPKNMAYLTDCISPFGLYSDDVFDTNKFTF